jgi:hypothetical protein
MTRAALEARPYSEIREAFGRRFGRFPMVAGQIAGLEKSAERSTAGVFKLYRKFLQLDGKMKLSLNPAEPVELRRRRSDVRELVIEHIFARLNLTEDKQAAVEKCRWWDGFCHRLLNAYQDLAVDEVHAGTGAEDWPMAPVPDS